jgi:aromatic ring-cleaving dioxygenase
MEEGSGKLGAEFGTVHNYGCNVSTDPHPYTWSYHIHIIFTKKNKDVMEKFTGDFREQFMGGRDQYNPCRPMSFLEDLWNFDSVDMDDVERHHLAKPCQQFMVNANHTPFTAGGPFLHHNTGFTVSPTQWHEVLPWVMANRPDIDGFWVMTHPNTGCQYNDVKHWSGWAGTSTLLFYPILGERSGCVWAGCNDKTLGCIAFNHLGAKEGYGQCFNPPLNWDKPLSATGTMTLLPGSNITDMTWEDQVVV